MKQNTLAALLLLIPACQAPKTSDRDIVTTEVREARRLIEAREGVLGVATKPAGAWIDPRTEDQFAAGHIPGAVHLPLAEARKRYFEFREFGTLIVYGDTWGSPIASAMCKLLIELGHDDVRVLAGGLQGWREAGETVETGAKRRSP